MCIEKSSRYLLEQSEKGMKSKRKTARKIWIALASPILIFLIFWGASLIKCEILTEMKREVVEEYLASEEGKRMLDCEVEYFKVLSVNKHFLRVYCITEDNDFGEIAILETQYDGWEYYHKGKCVLLTDFRESADNFVWPYWHHVYTRR